MGDASIQLEMQFPRWYHVQQSHLKTLWGCFHCFHQTRPWVPQVLWQTGEGGKQRIMPCTHRKGRDLNLTLEVLYCLILFNLLLDVTGKVILRKPETQQEVLGINISFFCFLSLSLCLSLHSSLPHFLPLSPFLSLLSYSLFSLYFFPSFPLELFLLRLYFFGGLYLPQDRQPSIFECLVSIQWN